MSTLRVMLIVSALLTSGALVRMLRREHLREKYAVVWLALLPVVVLLAAFPVIIDASADALGVAEAPNLLFLLGSLFLLLVSVRLSVELSTLEDETRALAEEIAILRAQVEHDSRDRE